MSCTIAIFAPTLISMDVVMLLTICPVPVRGISVLEERETEGERVRHREVLIFVWMDKCQFFCICPPVCFHKITSSLFRLLRSFRTHNLQSDCSQQVMQMQHLSTR